MSSSSSSGNSLCASWKSIAASPAGHGGIYGERRVAADRVVQGQSAGQPTTNWPASSAPVGIDLHTSPSGADPGERQKPRTLTTPADAPPSPLAAPRIVGSR